MLPGMSEVHHTGAADCAYITWFNDIQLEQQSYSSWFHVQALPAAQHN